MMTAAMAPVTTKVRMVGVNLNGGRSTPVGRFLEDLSSVMLKVVKIVTYYAPIAFFGIFADLVATYGPQITEMLLPPLRFTPKPNNREKTISGSMARRESRLTKSSAVKKLTII